MGLWRERIAREYVGGVEFFGRLDMIVMRPGTMGGCSGSWDWVEQGFWDG